MYLVPPFIFLILLYEVETAFRNYGDRYILTILTLCPICAKEIIHAAWCQECANTYFKKNFINWTSGNQRIDEIIKDAQINSKIPEDFIEWIPYEQFENIEKVCHGGFGTIYSGYWTQGPLNMISNEFKRTGETHVALKSGISSEHLEE
ncbi:21676_t:CDS:1, partial [Dentiscutata erythropus]